MWWRLKWVVLWSLWAARLVRQPTPPVLTSSGWVRGSVAHSGNYIQYSGIPYATFVHRFQAPGPAPIWDGVFEAVDEHIKCTQMTKPFDEALDHPNAITGQDDCLILNVYTPAELSEPLPVMVFIHGGAFQEGSSVKKLYGPEFLVSKGVVLVTINYRLSVPGFLCLGIKEAPGNVGLKDQVAALRWIQRNIRAFGGDPANVTIFGESAGSASVSLHVLSPMSKGLFHKTIQQSGSSLASWTIQVDPIEIAHFKAKAVGYTNTSKDPLDLYKFFKSKTDVEILTRLTKRVEGNIVQSRTIFTPCVEKELEGVEPFLTELPITLLEEGRYNKVPMIIGSNSIEGVLFLSIESDVLLPSLDMAIIMPRDFVYPNDGMKRKMADEVKKLYMGDDEISVETKSKLVKFYGEPFFNYPASEESELIRSTSDQPIYNYIFQYDGWRNLPKFISKSDLRALGGATHADELFYLFSQELWILIPAVFETRMIDVMSTMWTNFAKYGDPTPQVSELLPIRWPALKAEDQRSLIIDQDLTTAPLWYNNSTLPYWKDVHSKYRRKV